MNLKRKAWIAFGAILISCFPVSSKATAIIEHVEYVSWDSQSGEGKIIISGKNLKDLTYGNWEDIDVSSKEVISPKEEELSFSERILNEKKPKPMETQISDGGKKRQMIFTQGKAGKTLEIQGPAEFTAIDKASFSLQIPDGVITPRWGESIQSEWKKPNKKEGRKKEQLEFLFIRNARPLFRPENEEALKGKVIIIDPGHGGKDVGAVGLSGVYEKDINLSVGLEMEKELKKWGAIPVMVRAQDTYAMDDLGDRVAFGLKAQGDIFVSLHSDAASNRAAKGFTIYYHSGKGLEDLRLAKSVHERMKAVMQTQDRGTRSANFYVVKRNSLPAILIEMGFISNPYEEKELTNPDYQRDVVEGTVQGLADFFAAK